MLPIEYSGDVEALVVAFQARERDKQIGAYWSDDEVKPIKKVIKTHYIDQQKRLCCYCNRDLATNHHGVWDCEHVIPKATHPQWLFTPLNLAVACKDCNLAKSDDPVLENNSRVTFPINSLDYVIVHPHFDKYEEHIRWIGSVPRPNGSDKGRKTIYMCDLLRFAASEAGITSSPSDRRYDQLVGDLMKRPGPNDARMILAALEADLLAIAPESSGAGAAEDVNAIALARA